MMKLKPGLATAALVLGIALGAPALAKVSVQQAPSTALARGSSYAWAPIAGVALGAPAPAIVNQITADRLHAATESVLAERGFRRVDDPAEADLIIGYRVITSSQIEADLTSRGGVCAPFCFGRSDYDLDTSQKTHGVLVLDMVDRRAGRLVYRATSEKEITSKDASSERLTSLLMKMTKSLPSR